MFSHLTRRSSLVSFQRVVQYQHASIGFGAARLTSTPAITICRFLSTTSSSESAQEYRPLHRTMRAAPRASSGDEGANEASKRYFQGRSVYNGLISKRVAVTKTPKSDFRFIPIPGKSVDSSRKEFLHYYEGYWVDGLPHGEGTLTFPNGNVFKGDFSEGRCEGFGVETTAEGTLRYEGAWVDNKPGGVGRMVLKDGGVYTGEFVNGSREGLGRLVMPSGSTYFGHWAQNKRHGEGILTDGKTGKRLSVLYDYDEQEDAKPYTPEQGPSLDDTVITVFERDLADGVRPGSKAAAARISAQQQQQQQQEQQRIQPTIHHGTVAEPVAVTKSRTSGFRFKAIPAVNLKDFPAEHLHKYEGEWLDGVPHGPGKLSLPNGHLYEGEMTDGRCEGWGIEYNHKGSVRYEGQWVDNKPGGVGRLRWKNNTIFTGEFSNGSMDGLGRLVEMDGTTHIGFWADNTRCERTPKKKQAKLGNDKNRRAVVTQDRAVTEADLKRLEEFDALLQHSRLPAYPVGAPKPQLPPRSSPPSAATVSPQDTQDTVSAPTEPLPELPPPGSTPVSIVHTSPVSADIPLMILKVSAVLTYADGSTYTGEATGNGMRHGTGVSRNAEGRIVHTGKWKFDQLVRTKKVVSKAKAKAVALLPLEMTTQPPVPLAGAVTSSPPMPL